MILACYMAVIATGEDIMSRSTLLARDHRHDLAASAQIVAHDPGIEAPVAYGNGYLRSLQLTNQLSRFLDVEQILEAFLQEVNEDIPCCGYSFHAAELGAPVEFGLTRGAHRSYQLKVQNRDLGELTLYKPDRFTSEELLQLTELLPALIFPIKNALMYQVALKSAYRDPLTGLNNRTAMEKYLPREIELARRYRQSLAILIMDLDGFKQINDTCGHDCGDQVLRDVGQVISHVMRNTDLVYRYGGDEFVGGLPRSDVRGASDVAERIRSSIERLDLSKCCGIKRVQMSIGITLLQPIDDFRSAFKRADKALYQAKLNGKNRIVVY